MEILTTKKLKDNLFKITLLSQTTTRQKEIYYYKKMISKKKRYFLFFCVYLHHSMYNKYIQVYGDFLSQNYNLIR